MSSFNVSSFPALSGGLPTKPDETPSIVFTIAYVVLLLPALWRTYTYRHPGSLLFTFVRLCLFIIIRILTFGLRAEEASTASLPDNPVPNTDVFIAEQVLLGIGFIVVIDLIVELLKSHIWRTDVPQQSETPFAQQGSSKVLQRIVRIMHFALLGAIGIGIVAGTMYSSAMTDPSKASTVKTLRIASAVISLVVAGLCAGVCLLLLMKYPHLGIASTCYLLVTSCIMVVVPAYRLSTSITTPPEADLVSQDTRLKFYILQALMEWLVAAALVLVDARIWFFAGGDAAQMMLGRTKYGVMPGAGSGDVYPLNPRAQAPMGSGQGQYRSPYGRGYA